jgi:hypothetical protein
MQTVGLPRDALRSMGIACLRQPGLRALAQATASARKSVSPAFTQGEKSEACGGYQSKAGGINHLVDDSYFTIIY